MESVHGSTREQSQLLGVVHGVRARYRAKLALRGAAITIAAGWALIALGGVVMNAFHYSDGVVLTVRVIAIASILAMLAWFVVRPLLPKLHDEQVALYLEEHEHSLNASVITAVEMQNGERSSLAMRSPAIIDRLTRTALERVRLAGDGKAIDAGESKRSMLACNRTALDGADQGVCAPASVRRRTNPRVMTAQNHTSSRSQVPRALS